MHRFRQLLAMTVTAAMVWPAGRVAARPLGHEAQLIVDSLLAPPPIKAESGFSAKMIVAPGEFYDPLFMVPRGGTVWINDDGRAIDGHGSRILEVTPDGKIKVLMDAAKMTPVTGFDLAPAEFGGFGGQLFSIAQPGTAMAGATANHVIQRIDVAKQSAAVFCTLPAAGSVGKGIAGFGVDGRFGPPGTSFANVFFAVTALNDMIYAAYPDGTCTQFADLSKYGAPFGISFSPDGSAMLVTVSPGEVVASESAAKGMILRLDSNGAIDPKPVAAGLVRPAGLDLAPAGFGAYTGQIFVADMGDIQIPVPQTQQLKRDGRIYRVTPHGRLELVASGFVNPAGLRFIGDHLWVTDINGDFIAGMRELPDGFLVQIDAR